MQKNWIGRSEGLLVRFGLESPRHGAGHRASSRSTRPGPTRCSAPPSWRSRADHPLAKPQPRDDPRCRPSSRNAAACRHLGSGSTTAEKGFDTGIARPSASIRNWQLPVYVANFVLMDYGTGAIFGCPAHDQRDLDFAQQIRSARHPWSAEGPTRAVSSSPMTAYVGDGRMINSRFLDGMTPERERRGRPPARRPRLPRQCAQGRAQGQFPPARLGRLAPALLGLPDPGHPLRPIAACTVPVPEKPICR